MRFSDESVKGTASDFVQISEKVRQRPLQWIGKWSGKKAWYIWVFEWHACSWQTKNGDKGWIGMNWSVILWVCVIMYMHDDQIPGVGCTCFPLFTLRSYKEWCWFSSSHRPFNIAFHLSFLGIVWSLSLVLYLQLANTETELQNSPEAVDEEEYVGEVQIVAPSDTFPQGNLQSSGHQGDMRSSL
jgi:hypothetical protein